MKISLSQASVPAWLLAFFLSFTFVTRFENEFFMGMMICIFIALGLNDASGITKREWKIPLSPVLIAAGGFWLVSLISMATSDILFVSWIYFFFLSVLPFTLMFFLVGDDFEKRQAQAWAGISLILAGVSFYAIYQYFFLPNYLFMGRVQEPLADPNSLAAVFSLGIFLLGGRILKAGKNIKWQEALTLFLLVAGFFTTGSRGAFLSLGIMLVLFLFSTGLRKIGRHSWLALGGIALAALVLIGVMYTPTFYSGPLKVLDYSFGQSVQIILHERGMIWHSALQLIKAHPYLGTGPGTFQFYYGEVKNIADTTAGFTVHNDPLQFAVELGIFSTLLFYVICILICCRTFKAIKKLAQDDGQRYDILIPFFALAALALHSHLTADFHVLPCLMLAGFAFSIWYMATAKALDENSRVVTAPASMSAASLKTLFVITAIFMSALIALPLYSQRLAVDAREDLEKGELQDFVRKVDLADEFSAGTNVSVLVLAAGIPLGILEPKDNTVSEKDRYDFLSQIHLLLTRAEKYNPRNADVFWMKGRLAKIEARKDDERINLEQAIRINPAHMSARLALADYWEKNNHLDKAVEIMTAGEDVRYAPKDVERYFEYIMRSGHMKERLAKEYEAASQKVPYRN